MGKKELNRVGPGREFQTLHFVLAQKTTNRVAGVKILIEFCCVRLRTKLISKALAYTFAIVTVLVTPREQPSPPPR